MEVGGTVMGYCTSFSLTTEGTPEAVKAFNDDLAKSSKYKEDIQELFSCGCIDGKFYDLPDEVEAAAGRHPDVLVILDGDGEDSGDIWQMRCRGKKCECHRVVMPPFTSPALLTEDEKQEQTN